MSKTCCVCSEAKESKDNAVFSCKGHGCDVNVHQGCYGIVTVPTGLWFCRKCESQERAARVRCELCPRKEGALKRTDSGGWAHVVCALYIPEVVFGNNRIMEPIITSKLPKERFSKSCYICEERGNETNAGYGACMSCHKSSCRLAFHVTCAQKDHLLCEEEDPRDPRNVIYCGYCKIHHKKMMRQRHRQALQIRKPSFTASTTSSLFPTTPTSPSVSSATPLSSLPDLVGSEGGVEHRLERTGSGSPIKIIKREPQSQNDLPAKRPSMNSSIHPPKAKRRQRKPSSSNESTTSEAPSNASDLLPLMPPSLVPPSPSSSITNHLIPGSLLLLPGANNKGHLESGRGQKGREEGHAAHEEVVQMLVAGAEQFSASGMPARGEVAGGNGRRVTSSSTSSDQSSRTQAQAPPPRSLQDLLERQWEQTAQFILDQAGKQNNAGSMLAHLHNLQSENRKMQSRIMELASQREFYIAINTKLRQTLTEHELGRLPNGVQPGSDGLQQVALRVGSDGGGGSGGGIEAMDIEHPSRSSYPIAGNRHTHHHHQSSSSSNMEMESSVHLIPPGPAPLQHSTSSSMPKEEQDSFLQAHFSSPAITNHSNASISSGTYPISREKEDHGTLSQQHHYHQDVDRGSGQQGGKQDLSHCNSAPLSNFIPTLTQLPPQTTASQNLPSIHASTNNAIPPHSHAPLVDYPNCSVDMPQQEVSVTLQEITRVTHSVQAPISSFPPIPNDLSSSNPSSSNTGKLSGNNMLNLSSNKDSKRDTH